MTALRLCTLAGVFFCSAMVSLSETILWKCDSIGLASDSVTRRADGGAPRLGGERGREAASERDRARQVDLNWLPAHAILNNELPVEGVLIPRPGLPGAIQGAGNAGALPNGDGKVAKK